MLSLQLDLSDRAVPSIEIWLASPEQLHPEPKSPFTALPPLTPDLDDSFRPTHLSPPPHRHSSSHSPLRPTSPTSNGNGKGLDRERFEALLKASRERSPTVGAKRAVDLRKEVAIKAHQNKQAERRALFLSKVQAPPSPTAACLPKTPPESPAIFHYTLPSPGLVSPLAMFGRVGDDSAREEWVEEVNFSLPKQTSEHEHKLANLLPSLEQITARLNAQGHGIHSVSVTTHTKPRRSIPLPAFLQARRNNSPPAINADPVTEQVVTTTSGRLRLPIRRRPATSVVPSSEHAPAMPMAAPQPRVFLPPISPVSPKLQIKTTVIRSPSRTPSPTELTERNLALLNSREIMTNNMLCAIRRRMAVTNRAASVHEFEDETERIEYVDHIKAKRFSAPPELPRRERSGFTHPVFNMAGGF